MKPVRLQQLQEVVGLLATVGGIGEAVHLATVDLDHGGVDHDAEVDRAE